MESSPPGKILNYIPHPPPPFTRQPSPPNQDTKKCTNPSHMHTHAKNKHPPIDHRHSKIPCQPTISIVPKTCLSRGENPPSEGLIQELGSPQLPSPHLNDIKSIDNPPKYSPITPQPSPFLPSRWMWSDAFTADPQPPFSTNPSRMHVMRRFVDDDLKSYPWKCAS